MINQFIETSERFAIVNKETNEVWGSDLYHNTTGAKTSFYHTNKYYDRSINKYCTIRFDDQDKFEIVKVKLVRVDD